MKKVQVNEELCIGCGACVSIASNYFQFNDNGYSEVIKNEIDDNDEEVVADAISCCPVDAIEIDEQ